MQTIKCEGIVSLASMIPALMGYIPDHMAVFVGLKDGRVGLTAGVQLSEYDASPRDGVELFGQTLCAMRDRHGMDNVQPLLFFGTGADLPGYRELAFQLELMTGNACSLWFNGELFDSNLKLIGAAPLDPEPVPGMTATKTRAEIAADLAYDSSRALDGQAAPVPVDDFFTIVTDPSTLDVDPVAAAMIATIAENWLPAMTAPQLNADNAPVMAEAMAKLLPRTNDANVLCFAACVYWLTGNGGVVNMIGERLSELPASTARDNRLKLTHLMSMGNPRDWPILQAELTQLSKHTN